MRAPARGTRPRKSTFTSLPVPTSGWISNRNIALPNGAASGPGAQVMDNWFPTASSARLRRGIVRIATMPDGLTVKSLFTYSLGASYKLFASTDGGIWDITDVQSAYDNILTPGGGDYLSPGDDEAFGWDSVDPDDNLWTTTNGDWTVIQFATAGGTFLVGVNGHDDGFLYDGTTFSALNVEFPDGVDLTSADLSFVWAYKKRIYFIQKNSLDVWYLTIDSIGGTLTKLPLGGVFNRGGSLIWGQTWSLASGGDGGLSEQNTFCTTEGEVAIYQGLSPDDASDWSKVGVYRVGKPMGKKAFIRAGGDLVIATTIGFIPLSKAIDMDYAALGIVAISSPIADEWRNTVSSRGGDGWVCELWGEGSMTVVSPPTLPNDDKVSFIANSDTGAWCRFTNWYPTAITIFNGQLIFGGPDGKVQRAWVGGNDEGDPYTGVMVPLFSDMGTPGQRKIGQVARAVKRSRYPAREQVNAIYDWDTNIPSSPDTEAIAIGNEWGNAIWGQSVWGAQQQTIVTEEWKSIAGSGYAVSLVLQVTSGAVVPLDVELVRMDLTYEAADIIS